MQNNNLASEKQINYLRNLGYKGSVEGMTMSKATELIQQWRELNEKEPLDNQPKQEEEVKPQTKPRTVKQEVAPAQNNAVAKKMPFSTFMSNVGTRLVANAITDEKRKSQFIANIVSAVSNNPTLQECDQTSVLSAALQADALHFPVNNSLGYCYLVPFNDKKANMKKAQFQIGYKGYIQLAIRSGQYKNINVSEVKEGELNEYDPLKGMSFNWITDYAKRKTLKTIGYAGEITLMNGFTKTIYISYEEMLDHANTYSQAFNLEDYKAVQSGKVAQKDMWKYSSFWYKNFDEMALKTVLRRMLSKWGIMSVEMQQAYDNDMAAFDMKGNREYIDSKELEKSNIEDVINMQQAESGQKDLFDNVDENGVVMEDDNI